MYDTAVNSQIFSALSFAVGDAGWGGEQRVPMQKPKTQTGEAGVHELSRRGTRPGRVFSGFLCKVVAQLFHGPAGVKVTKPGSRLCMLPTTRVTAPCEPVSKVFEPQGWRIQGKDRVLSEGRSSRNLKMHFCGLSMESILYSVAHLGGSTRKQKGKQM